MKIILQFVIYCALFISVNAQILPKANDYPELGLKFEIQDGWTAEQQGQVVMMGHQTIPGLIIMSFNDAESAEALKQQALKGVIDQGVNLRAVGDFTIKNSNQVSGYYEGTWDGEQVKCFAIGKINSYGTGVNVMAITTSELFTDVHTDEIITLAATVKFYKPVVSDQSVQWRNKLVPSLVKYISSSYSTDYSGGSTGSSSTESITLCSNGFFTYYSNDQVSFSAGDGSGSEVGSGYGNSNENSEGNFEIKSFAGTSYLVLNFNSGQVYEYALSVNEKGNTLLNGTRYFVVENEYCE